MADLMLDLSAETDAMADAEEARRLLLLLEAYMADPEPCEQLGPDGREGSAPQLLTGYGGVLLWAVRDQRRSRGDLLRPQHHRRVVKQADVPVGTSC